jgi:transposase
MRRLKGRALALTPLYWRDEPRIVGLIFLLSIALRVLILRQFVVRKNLQQEGATLQGIYPGQPGRHTTLPTTEMMLGAFRGITLSRVTINGGTILEKLAIGNSSNARIRCCTSLRGVT